MFDFDSTVHRTDWNSLKWTKYQDRDVLPFWVADMDFATPNFIIEAILGRLKHPILGYTSPPPELIEAFVAWTDRMFDWQIEPEWVVPLNAVVPGINVALKSLGADGDYCLVPVPVYPPILEAPEQNQRYALHTSLVRGNDRWTMDFDDIANKARDSVSLVLCNPQNPTGRVYTETELRKLASICLETNTVIISDEIHWGIILDTNCKHIPLASLSQEIANNTITLISHTKSYNIAGLLSAIAVVPNGEIRERMEVLMKRVLPSGSPLAYAAGIAAYRDTGTWLPELTSYLRSNKDLVKTVVSELPRVNMTDVEGTHLAWIDATCLPIQDPAAYFEAFGIGLSDGAEFGAPGFVRLNFAAPKDLLQRGLQRFQKAVECAS